ncbi:uncharacterized protein LOC125547344 [Triticum urartu]|nr:uncharacterized protein LOC125547344 [Triticum urartu]
MVSLMLANVMLQSLFFISMHNKAENSASDYPNLVQYVVFLFISKKDKKSDTDYRKLVAPLTMFLMAIAYVAGLSTPGGFWDSAEGGHHPGDGILHGVLLRLFSWGNIGAFVSSLYGVFLILGRGLQVKLAGFYMKTALVGLIISYTVGSSRGRHTTVNVICSLCAAVGAYIMLHMLVMKAIRGSRFWPNDFCHKVTRWLERGSDNNTEQAPPTPGTSDNNGDQVPQAQGTSDNNGDQVSQAQGTSDNNGDQVHDKKREQRQRQRRLASLVQLLAGLAVSITYQAGLYPPGGVWQDGHMAGDPILLTTNAGRYKAFFYCNTVAFAASLLAIFLAQKSYLNEHHALQAAMILHLLGLIVAYAIGSCRDQISSMYAVGIAGAAVVYVVVHVQYFTLGSEDEAPVVLNKEKDDALVDKKGHRFLLFAILVASITYQAGLTPPGGFLLQDDIQSGHRAGDPVLLYNYPRRYKAFFYCNSVSFMLSTVLILLLVNPNMYRPAIRSHALSLCSAVSFICLIGAFAAGSTQHLRTSFYIFVLAAVAVFVCLLLLLTIYLLGWLTEEEEERMSEDEDTDMENEDADKENEVPDMEKKIYLMTLAILVGSVTYQSGLDPPGGSWQSTGDGHDAGNPVMHGNRRNRYLAFLYGNSTSFLASIYLIELLLFSMSYPECNWLKTAIEPTVVVQFLGFLVAYAAGSSRQWKTSAHVGTLVIAVLAYVATHVMLSNCRTRARKGTKDKNVSPTVS